jgi:hypothetical protein
VNNGTEGGLNPYDGQQWINFNGNNTAPGGILSQTFTTVIGRSYKVSFAVGGVGSGNVSLTATALALNSLLLASNYCVPTSGVWTLFQLAFIAVSTNTTLVFTDTSVATVAVDIALDGVTVSESTPPSFLTNSLLAYYPFNGNANDMVGTNNGTTFNATLANDRFGNPNHAYSFNGTNSYIVCPDTGFPAGNAPRTVSLWIYFRSFGVPTPTDTAVISYGSGQANDTCYLVLFDSGLTGYPDNTIAVGESGGGGVGNHPLWTGVQLQQWYHISFSDDGTIAQLYVNGMLQGSTSRGYATVLDGHFLIGSYTDALGQPYPPTLDGFINDVRVYNRALSDSEVQQLYAYESVTEPTNSVSPITATATPEVVNGFVVGATITDGGFGYTNTPTVQILGGGGSGAQAVAVVSNEVVIAIHILDAGSNYINTPVVVIDPPFIPNPVLGIAPLSFLTFSNLTLGGVYQLQQLAGWYWTNQPVNFTATNSVYSQMVSGVAGSGDYRLALNPVPTQAFAVPEVVNGFVVGATLTSGGSGYITSPPVRILGGGGTNATAFSEISSGGVVTNILITDAGIGYTNTPTIQIAQPPAAAVSPTVQLVMRVDSSNLAPYDNYQIQFTPALGTPWGNWNGGLFIPTDVTNSQYLFVTNAAGFFRLQYLP